MHKICIKYPGVHNKVFSAVRKIWIFYSSHSQSRRRYFSFGGGGRSRAVLDGKCGSKPVVDRRTRRETWHAVVQKEVN